MNETSTDKMTTEIVLNDAEIKQNDVKTKWNERKKGEAETETEMETDSAWGSEKGVNFHTSVLAVSCFLLI